MLLRSTGFAQAISGKSRVNEDEIRWENPMGNPVFIPMINSKSGKLVSKIFTEVIDIGSIEWLMRLFRDIRICTKIVVEWDVEFTPCPTVLWWNCFARSQPGQPGHVARFRGFAHEVPPIPVKVFLMCRWHKACLDVVQCGQATNIRSRNQIESAHIPNCHKIG